MNYYVHNNQLIKIKTTYIFALFILLFFGEFLSSSALIPSGISSNKKKVEILCYSKGLRVATNKLRWTTSYAFNAISKDDKELQKIEVPIFSELFKQSRFSVFKKKITLHVIGQYTNNGHHLVLFDCTELMSNGSYKGDCKPFAVVDMQVSKIEKAGAYVYSKDGKDCFYIHKIVDDYAIFQRKWYTIAFAKQLKRPDDKRYNTYDCIRNYEYYEDVNDELYAEFPFLCGGVTYNSELKEPIRFWLENILEDCIEYIPVDVRKTLNGLFWTYIFFWTINRYVFKVF